MPVRLLDNPATCDALQRLLRLPGVQEIFIGWENGREPTYGEFYSIRICLRLGHGPGVIFATQWPASQVDDPFWEVLEFARGIRRSLTDHVVIDVSPKKRRF